MAGLLYDSLHEKLLTLPDAVEVYPAHGAGSLCGKNISKETWSTIGEQRRTNHALQPMSRDAFIEKMTADLPEQPRYFGMDVEINRRGASALDAREPPPALDAGGVRGAGGRGGGGRGRAVQRRVRGGARSRDRSTSGWAASSRPGRARCSIPRGRC